jgi:hypothetical protein
MSGKKERSEYSDEPSQTVPGELRYQRGMAIEMYEFMRQQKTPEWFTDKEGFQALVHYDQFLRSNIAANNSELEFMDVESQVVDGMYGALFTPGFLDLLKLHDTMDAHLQREQPAWWDGAKWYERDMGNSNIGQVSLMIRRRE